MMKISNKLPAKLRAIGYVRVSTNEQATEGISLDNQKHKIRVYAELKDLELVEIIADEGKSGKNLKRDGVQKMIQMVLNKEVDAVVVYKLDRLTRKTQDLLHLFEDVFDERVAFYSLNENIDTTTAQGKFFLTLMGAMAQMERDLISERTTDALSELTRQGRRLGSPDFVPFGFTQAKRKKATFKDLKSDTKNMEIVNNIFRLRKENNSLSVIGSKYGMAKSTVKYILDNKIYAQKGVLSFN